MSNNNLSQEDKRNIQLHTGVTASLIPQTPVGLKIALTDKQNFALAAEEIFCRALDRTVWNYREDYYAVETFMTSIRNTAMESVATEKGISRIADMVFGDAGMREFIFSLRTQFYSQFAEFHTYWEDLIKFIALSLTTGEVNTSFKSELSLIPEDLRIRTYEPQQMADLLLANSWLVMFLLTALWGRTFTYAELRANYRQTVATNTNA